MQACLSYRASTVATHLYCSKHKATSQKFGQPKDDVY